MQCPDACIALFLAAWVAAPAAGAGAAAAGHAPTSRLVFATAAPEGAGFVGGLTGADDVCRQTARAAGHEGVFLAWLGDGALGPADRFDRRPATYVNVRGEAIGDHWSALGKGRAASLVLDLNGHRPTRAPWSNVDPDGTSGPLATSCDRWWTATRSHVGAVDGPAAVSSCDEPRPFYCVQQ